MPDYIIATSSTADLQRPYLDEHNVPFVSYSYTVDSELFQDDCRDESREAVYKGMRAGDKLRTSMINEFIYYDFFKSILETGKDLIYLDMSKEMSVSFANANKAADMIRRDFPDRKLYVMDTLCISGGLGLLVENMVSRMEQGMSWDEVIAWGEGSKLKIAHRFTVDDLNYLKAGGRVSNASALVGSLLSVKPVLYVPDGGTLDVAKKVRGRKSALNTIVAGVKNDLARIDPAGVEIHILQADCVQDAEYVRDEIRRAYPLVGEFKISALGVVIGAHCGPGLLTVFYLCDGRRA